MRTHVEMLRQRGCRAITETTCCGG
jgi:hypothetical protein